MIGTLEQASSRFWICVSEKYLTTACCVENIRLSAKIGNYSAEPATERMDEKMAQSSYCFLVALCICSLHPSPSDFSQLLEHPVPSPGSQPCAYCFPFLMFHLFSLHCLISSHSSHLSMNIDYYVGNSFLMHLSGGPYVIHFINTAKVCSRIFAL